MSPAPLMGCCCLLALLKSCFLTSAGTWIRMAALAPTHPKTFSWALSPQPTPGPSAEPSAPNTPQDLQLSPQPSTHPRTFSWALVGNHHCLSQVLKKGIWVASGPDATQVVSKVSFSNKTTEITGGRLACGGVPFSSGQEGVPQNRELARSGRQTPLEPVQEAASL